jgi:hypothetical protein
MATLVKDMALAVEKAAPPIYLLQWNVMDHSHISM